MGLNLKVISMKPINALILISIGHALFLSILLALYGAFVDPIGFNYILLISVSSALVFFLISFLFFKSFIENRIKSIYRIIHYSGKPNSTLRDDAVLEAKKATIKWASERQTEIEALKEDAKFRREFVGNLAHELKTPVFNIQGYLLTLLEGGLEDEKVNRKFLERAALSTEKMAEMIEDLDQIMQLEANSINLKKENFDLTKLVDDTIELLEEKASERMMEIHRQKMDGPVLVFADRNKIGQVLTNLISNAINYSNDKSKIEIQFYTLGNSVITEVIDYGIGISEQDRPRIFERFYRVDQSRNSKAGGTGLGLSICKHILEAHNETITLKSKLKSGTTFSFSLSKPED